MHQDYPHMLYLGGKLGAEYLIVADAGEEAHAKSEGFTRYGSKPAQDKPAAPDNLQGPPNIAPAPKRGRPAKAR